MEKNPYETPIHEEIPVAESFSGRRNKFDWLYVPLAWAILLFILWTQHGMFSDRSDIPVWLKGASSGLTAISILVLLLAIRGWRWFISLPLIAYLVWIQYLVWTFYANR